MGKNNSDDVNENRVSGQANKPLSAPAHALANDAVSSEIGANTNDGLTTDEAKSRLEEYGRNELDDGPGVQPIKILVRQVANAMMLVKRPMSSTKPTMSF
jgi:Na+-exporting ATPase